MFAYYCTFQLTAVGICTFIALISGVSAPYGRYTDRAWGFQINAKVAWIVMESPSFFVSLWCFFQSGSAPLVNTLLVSLFMFHYINRSFIFPLLMRGNLSFTPLYSSVSIFVSFFVVYVIFHFNFSFVWAAEERKKRGRGESTVVNGCICFSEIIR